jgi:hypothetical protein
MYGEFFKTSEQANQIWSKHVAVFRDNASKFTLYNLNEHTF